MKKIWAICKKTYVEWLLRSQTLILIPVLLFFYIMIIEPMCYYADALGTPLGCFEPYLCLMNSTIAVPVLPLVFLFLLAGYPKLNAFSTFQLYRVGKKKWFWGQCLFLLFAALTVLICFFGFSVLLVADRTFLANGWSVAARQIHQPQNESLAQNSGYAVIDRSVLNQIRPYSALIVCTMLQLFYMLIAGMVDFYLTVCGQKLLGILCNVTGIGAGMILLIVDVKWKWLFSASHSVFAWHSDAVLNMTYCPLWFSYLYDGLLLLILIILTLWTVKHCSLFSVIYPE